MKSITYSFEGHDDDDDEKKLQKLVRGILSWGGDG